MIKEAIAKLIEKNDLTKNEAEAIINQIMHGEATPTQIGAFLTALRIKGETVDEIAGSARAMRTNAIKVTTNQKLLLDTCGTGGDGTGTFNISTVASLIVAGTGLAIAKHGNRSVSSRCGSADLLETLGVKIDLGPTEVARCIDEVGIGFLFAPRFHPAMKYAAEPRREMGIRTIFNLLGPLTNPASTSVQLIGVYAPELTETLAQVLDSLGIHQALVVHGGGLDELSTTATNRISQLIDGQITTYYLDPNELGLPLACLDELKGGTPQENAKIALHLLHGEAGAKRDITLLNAAAALVAAGKAKDFKAGMAIAAESVDSGHALKKLEQFIHLSNAL